MNRSLLVAPLLAAMTFVACGRQSSFKLQLAGSSQLSADGDRSVVSMTSGDTLLLAVVVVGTAPTEVKLTTTDLPAFVKLDGAILHVTPARTEAGEYTFTVTATAGHESASLPVDLIVKRYNNPPDWAGSQVGFWLKDTGPSGCGNQCTGLACYQCPPCPGSQCTIAGTPILHTTMLDPDGDAVTTDIEVVPHGEPFKGTPTHSVTMPRSAPPGAGYILEISLSGLSRAAGYDFAIRIRDEFGALCVHGTTTGGNPPNADGWFQDRVWWTFYLNP